MSNIPIDIGWYTILCIGFGLAVGIAFTLYAKGE